MVFLLMAFWTAAGYGSDQASAGTLPDSLTSWYKPQSKRQVWLHSMFAMRRELQAVEEYAGTGDLPRLQKWAERLLTHYRKIQEMVPEWADELDPKAAADLEVSVRQGDSAGVLRATGRLQRTCRSCHREFKALAAARYRAPDFARETVATADGAIPYTDFMDRLSHNINRIKIASEDGRWEAASRAATTLHTRLNELAASCDGCHRDQMPVVRILGTGSEALLERLSQDIARQNAKDVGHHLGEAAVAICARCHGVHRTLSDLRRHLFDSD